MLAKGFRIKLPHKNKRQRILISCYNPVILSFWQNTTKIYYNKMWRRQTIIPSGWAIFWKAVGAIMIGMDILKPKTVVVKSILLTSIRIRGRNLCVYLSICFTISVLACIMKYQRNIINHYGFVINYCKNINLTKFWKRHFCSLAVSTDPLHQMRSNQTHSLVISALQ